MAQLRIYFRKNRKDLRLAEPPKRLFAGVEFGSEWWVCIYIYVLLIVIYYMCV